MSFRWIVAEEQEPAHCLDQLSFVEWMDFVFSRPTAGEDEERWYYRDEAEQYYFKDAALYLNRMTRLLESPELLLSGYSQPQIEQGFWCLISAFDLPDLIEDKDLDFEARRKCIAAFESLYKRLFKMPGFENIAFQYPNPLTFYFHEKKGKVADYDQLRVLDAMFETFCHILVAKERICFLSAARALSRLHHAKAPDAIAQALAQREDLWPGDADYARACIRGHVELLHPPLLQPHDGFLIIP